MERRKKEAICVCMLDIYDLYSSTASNFFLPLHTFMTLANNNIIVSFMNDLHFLLTRSHTLHTYL